MVPPRSHLLCMALMLLVISMPAQVPKEETALKQFWSGVSIISVYTVDADTAASWVQYTGVVGPPGQGKQFSEEIPYSIVAPAILVDKRAVGAGWKYRYERGRGVFSATCGGQKVVIKCGGEPWRLLAIELPDMWELFFVAMDTVADGSENVARCSIVNETGHRVEWDMLTLGKVQKPPQQRGSGSTESDLARQIVEAWQPQMDDDVIQSRPFAPRNDPTLRYRLDLTGLLSKAGLKEMDGSISQAGPLLSSGEARLHILFGRVPPGRQSFRWKQGLLECEVRDAWGTTLTPFWILRDSGKYYCGHSSILGGSWWWYLLKH